MIMLHIINNKYETKHIIAIIFGTYTTALSGCYEFFIFLMTLHLVWAYRLNIK